MVWQEKGEIKRLIVVVFLEKGLHFVHTKRMNSDRDLCVHMLTQAPVNKHACTVHEMRGVCINLSLSRT